jgi:hypothetical protein
MPNIQTTSAAQLLRATGNAGLQIAMVAKGPKVTSTAGIAVSVPEAAHVQAMGESFQRQLDAFKQVLLAPPPPVQKFNVVDAMGALIVWIGSAIVGGVTYLGAWFGNIYIGGTDASNAPIVADAAGNVTITGATITLTKNGVKTTIGNDMGPDGLTDSLSSEDISVANGQLTTVNPFAFVCNEWNPALSQYEAVAALRGTGAGSGRLLIGKVGGGSSILLAEDGAGSPQVLVNSGADTSFMRPLNILSGGDITATGNVFGGGTDMATLLADIATLNAAVATLTTSVAGKVGHGAAITGTADLITGAVTGSVS